MYVSEILILLEIVVGNVDPQQRIIAWNSVFEPSQIMRREIS